VNGILAPCAWQAFPYVFPFSPQTGAHIMGHMKRFAPGSRLTLTAADAPTTRATAATAAMILRPTSFFGVAAERSSMVP